MRLTIHMQEALSKDVSFIRPLKIMDTFITVGERVGAGQRQCLSNLTDPI